MRVAWLLIIIVLLSATCMRRQMEIDSEPRGARVFLDGKDVGRTPVDLPFSFHGTRRLDFVWEGEGEIRYRHETAAHRWDEKAVNLLGVIMPQQK